MNEWAKDENLNFLPISKLLLVVLTQVREMENKLTEMIQVEN